MDELAAAAAVAAIAVDDGAEAEKAHNSTSGIVEAAEVLKSIDGNKGVPQTPDSPSLVPLRARGACSLHDFRAPQTSFGSGRDRR